MLTLFILLPLKIKLGGYGCTLTFLKKYSFQNNSNVKNKCTVTATTPARTYKPYVCAFVHNCFVRKTDEETFFKKTKPFTIQDPDHQKNYLVSGTLVWFSLCIVCWQTYPESFDYFFLLSGDPLIFLLLI